MGSDPEEELNERDFIQERSPKSIWIFLLLFFLFIILMWGINYWQRSIQIRNLKEDPFYQVTNRDFSIFLWQNPDYMRPHADLSENYLPHFHTRDEIHVIPELADEYVSAPPDILYRYHAWKRLVGDYVSARPIFFDTFLEFLDSNPEWLPQNWKKAPKEYVQLVENLDSLDIVDLQSLSYEQLPLEARMAFMGWYNYMREAMQINLFLPAVSQLESFLEAHPQYARNYWRNLYPSYLLNREKKAPLKQADLTWFLKSAVFNFVQSQSLPDK